MFGTMPKTGLMLCRDNIILGWFDNYAEIAAFLKVTIDDEGNIYYLDKKRYPSYCLEGDKDSPISNNFFTKHEAIVDWVKFHWYTVKDGIGLVRYLKSR